MKKELLGRSEEGLFFILSAPAGTGKTTLSLKLQKEFPESIAQTVAYTTRKPRPSEVDGVHYHFISKEAFEQKIKNQDFIEYAKVLDHYYGTDKKELEALKKKGKHVILAIDTEGAKQLKKKIAAVYIFLLPPSLEELQKRLKHCRDDQKECEARLKLAEKEMSCAKDYDYQIVNKNLDVAYEVLRSIIIAEGHRVSN